MGATTGIAWTDSTQNWWVGCTKVGPGCDHCYAVDVGKRMEVGWGAGAPRRLTGEHNRNALARYQKGAAKFLAANGHRRRVFCSSLSDIFDNEVPDEWRAEAFADMEAAPDVLIQICTKRVSNIAKMIPEGWKADEAPRLGAMRLSQWPANVGVLITVVTIEEVLRDVPRLLLLKRQFGIPWIGLSIEPTIEDIEPALELLLGGGDLLRATLAHVDWIILGGESGSQARPCDLTWLRSAIATIGRAVPAPAIFVKQMGDNPLIEGVPVRFAGKGSDPIEWPVDLRVRQFPAALDG